MGLVLLSPPAVEPVSLAELKEYLRVDAGDASQDNLISTLGMAARSWAEVFTHRRFVRQSWRLTRDFFPGYYSVQAGQPGTSYVLSGPALLAGIRFAFLLDYPPVQSVDNFQYQNANGALTVLNPATDYIQDLQSNPARLTPVFGAMWPVARVVLNAVQIDYTVGYASPILVTTNAGSPPSAYSVSSSTYTFQATDVGRPLSIPGAGTAGAPLNTVISAVSSPPSGSATIRDAAGTTVTNASALLVNAAYGNPSHWEMIKGGIKMLVERWYEVRIPDESNIPMSVKAILWPVRDLRV